MSKGKGLKKEINFYTRYLYDPEKEAKKRTLIMLGAPLLGVILIVGGFFAFLKISDAISKNEIEDCKDYISSPSNTIEYQKSKELTKEKDGLVEQYNSLNGVLANIDSYPAMSSSLLGQVTRAIGSSGTVLGISYASSAGLLTVETQTATVENMPKLVENIRKTGLFYEISYTGYKSSDKKNYNASVLCVVKQP